jgi:hypothetical protein
LAGEGVDRCPDGRRAGRQPSGPARRIAPSGPPPRRGSEVSFDRSSVQPMWRWGSRTVSRVDARRPAPYDHAVSTPESARRRPRLREPVRRLPSVALERARDLGTRRGAPMPQLCGSRAGSGETSRCYKEAQRQEPSSRPQEGQRRCDRLHESTPLWTLAVRNRWSARASVIARAGSRITSKIARLRSLCERSMSVAALASRTQHQATVKVGAASSIVEVGIARRRAARDRRP